MKRQKQIAPIVIAATILVSCTNIPSSVVNTGIVVGTTTALRLAITDSAKRTAVANYIDVYAGAMRSITGSPTPEQLTLQINAFIPASVKANLPELLTFITPLIVSNYEALYDKYGKTGNAAKMYAGLNAFATDLEIGAAPYITKK